MIVILLESIKITIAADFVPVKLVCVFPPFYKLGGKMLIKYFDSIATNSQILEKLAATVGRGCDDFRPCQTFYVKSKRDGRGFNHRKLKDLI